MWNLEHVEGTLAGAITTDVGARNDYEFMSTRNSTDAVVSFNATGRSLGGKHPHLYSYKVVNLISPNEGLLALSCKIRLYLHPLGMIPVSGHLTLLPRPG